MTLLNKYTYLSNNLFLLLSYNKKSINISIRLIRLKLMYLFFYIYKKINIIKIYKKYKLYKIFISLLTYNNFKKNINLFFNTLTFYYILYKNIFFNFYKDFFLNFNYIFFFHINNSFLNYNYLMLLSSNLINFNSYFKHLNYFFYLYKKYNYVLYIWFYSIKYFKFFNLNWSSIKTRTKRWVVLRSPHSNKKSKEIFKLKKIKRAMKYPSFLFSNNIFFLKDIINENILLKNKIYLFKN
jgi:hypothetical protein